MDVLGCIEKDVSREQNVSLVLIAAVCITMSSLIIYEDHSITINVILILSIPAILSFFLISNLKKKIGNISIKKCIFFIEELDKSHHRTAQVLKITMWILVPDIMIALFIMKRLNR